MGSIWLLIIPGSVYHVMYRVICVVLLISVLVVIFAIICIQTDAYSPHNAHKNTIQISIQEYAHYASYHA